MFYTLFTIYIIFLSHPDIIYERSRLTYIQPNLNITKFQLETCNEILTGRTSSMCSYEVLFIAIYRSFTEPNPLTEGTN